ncbi:MAG TPA: aminotransferase class V-fold PLP-dependent enzyme [Ramlibacter sp.]|nr:aminotransferase class V-fold PLP-dependent enzyme [Ramlibacter sp.]
MNTPPSTPPFGHQRLGDFILAPGIDHLNHGAYGATPKVVLAACDRWREVMEADPSTFFRRDLPGHLRHAAARVAGFLGGKGEDWVFVENATAGINAIIASLRLEAGDELVCLSQVYGAVGNALRYHAERAGARVVKVQVPVPFTDPEPLLASLRAAVGKRTRLVVLDHVTSAGATVLPVAEMAAICRDVGSPVAIDGAHALGMLPLDVPALGVDYYVGNLHKWAFAARGAGALWCAPERQKDLHPVSISHYLGQGFNAEFDYSGTRDNSAWLAAPAALDYLEGLGAEAMRAHNNALADAAGRMLSEAWGSEISAAAPYRASMAAVRLPGSEGGDRTAARALATRLTNEHGITLGVLVMEGKLWIRVSAQVYNDLADYERIAGLGAKLLEPARS